MGTLGIDWLSHKDYLGDDFYSFESCRKSVFCFQAKIASLILYVIPDVITSAASL